MIPELIVLMLAIPIGYLIAWLARDELIIGRKYFRVLIIASIIGIIGFWLYGFHYISWTFGFVLIISLVSFLKSYNGKWTRK